MMSQIGLVLPKGCYEFEDLIKETAKQNLSLIVMEEVEWIKVCRYTEMHIIGSYGDVNLCDQILEHLSTYELESSRYDEGDRKLIWRAKGHSEKSKVFYNVSPELAEQLLVVSELN